MASKDSTFAEKLKDWLGIPVTCIGLLVGAYQLKEKMDGTPEKPAEKPAAAQVTRVEIVQATPGGGVVASAAPAAASDPATPSSSAPSTLVVQVVERPAAGVEATAPAAVKARAEPKIRTQAISPPQFPESRNFEYLEARASGEGITRAAAVAAALSSAVSMRLGATISGSIELSLDSERKSINEVESDKIRETLGARYESASKGVVKWWDWEREEYDGQNYSLRVVAILAKRKPKSMDPNARKIVAVLPFTVDRDVSLLAAKVEGARFGRALATASSNHLVQGRKFALIESGSETLAAVAAKAGNESLAGLIESADALEADYLLMGEASRVEVSRFKAGVGVLPKPTVSGSVDFRVVKIDTRQIVLSRKLDLGSLVADLGTGREPDAVLSDAIGAYVSRQLHDTVFPIKVLALNGESEVVLNRGGDEMRVGELFEIFTLGPVVKDPDTGESMQLELKSGEVKVSRVTPKMTYAIVVEKVGQIVPESTCRRK
jgi:hypothetical protein